MTLAPLPDALRALIERERLDVTLVSAEGAAHTAQEAARLLGVPVADIVKTLVLTDGKRFVAAIVPGDRRVDRVRVAAHAGTGKLRFANADEVLEHTGYPPGGVAPLAFARPLGVVVDASLARRDQAIIAGGGRPELLIRLPARTIVRAHDAIVADVCLEAACPPT
jgi:Cys-tRNA(Pro) deacylase